MKETQNLIHFCLLDKKHKPPSIDTAPSVDVTTTLY